MLNFTSDYREQMTWFNTYNMYKPCSCNALDGSCEFMLTTIAASLILLELCQEASIRLDPKVSPPFRLLDFGCSEEICQLVASVMQPRMFSGWDMDGYYVQLDAYPGLDMIWPRSHMMPNVSYNIHYFIMRHNKCNNNI